jgi:hypothetical protein
MPTYTDIQRIFNKSCIECHGGLGYPPYQTYGTYLDLSEDENPPLGDRRMTRSWTVASSLAGNPTSSLLVNRLTDSGRLAHPYDPDEPYNLASPDDPADPDVLDERCPYGLMPCGGPPLSWVDIETIRRWVEGGAMYSEGDPHIKTIDGVNYDLQTAGEFVLLRDEGLELQARHTPVTTAGPLGPNPYTGLSTCVSVNTAVAVRSGGQHISYQPRLRAPIDPDRPMPTEASQLVLRRLPSGAVAQATPPGRAIGRCPARGDPRTAAAHASVVPGCRSGPSLRDFSPRTGCHPASLARGLAAQRGV